MRKKQIFKQIKVSMTTANRLDQLRGDQSYNEFLGHVCFELEDLERYKLCAELIHRADSRLRFNATIRDLVEYQNQPKNSRV